MTKQIGEACSICSVVVVTVHSICMDRSPNTLGTSVGAEVVLSLEVLAAHLAGERHLRALVGALVDHQVVRLGEPALAVLAHKLALWPHLTAEVGPTVVIVNSHHREHFGGFLIFFFVLGFVGGSFFCFGCFRN